MVMLCTVRVCSFSATKLTPTLLVNFFQVYEGQPVLAHYEAVRIEEVGEVGPLAESWVTCIASY